MRARHASGVDRPQIRGPCPPKVAETTPAVALTRALSFARGGYMTSDPSISSGTNDWRKTVLRWKEKQTDLDLAQRESNEALHKAKRHNVQERIHLKCATSKERSFCLRILASTL